jgi:heme exporter protein C
VSDRKYSIVGQSLVSVVTAILVGISIYAAIIWAPSEKAGFVQRIFYFHVSSGMAAMFAFMAVFIGNIGYLIRRKPEWDWLALAGVEVGLAFTTIVLVTGSIWAKPSWGVWWAWDERLTSALVLWVLYFSYLLLRRLLENPERKAVVSAVFGAFAFLDVPLVYFSIWWWRTQHPGPIVAKGNLPRDMSIALFVSFAAISGFMTLMIWQRYKLEALRHTVAELQIEAEYRNDGGVK